jgi:aspartyl-tRNA(Asn)/glutamyl-tRNA(Gln) amidotransferase subunit B
MRSSDEAVAYARALHALVRWIGICDGNMQEGSFRCDANVSVRPKGQAEFGTRREIKNLNSFRFLKEAIDFEVQWQINEIEEGRKIQQATVLFDPDSGETRMMRSKEDAHDYRYFPDPDLLPLVIGRLDRPRPGRTARTAGPEARTLHQRLLGLSAYDAADADRQSGNCRFFRGDRSIGRQGQRQALRQLGHGRSGCASQQGRQGHRRVAGFGRQQLGGLIQRIADNTISNNIAKKVFEALWNGEGATADEVIDKQGLKQITDTGAIEALVDEVLAANAANVAEFKAGKEKAFNALVGQVMKAAKGKANPQQVNDLLKQKLAADQRPGVAVPGVAGGRRVSSK